MIPVRILFVEDSEDDLILVTNELRRGDFFLVYERVESADGLRTMLTEQKWDAIISDFNLPGFDGPTALKIAKELHFDGPFLLVSGTVGEAQAVEAMRLGATDYIMKNNLARLPLALKRELEEFEKRRQAEATLAEREKQLRESQKLEMIAQMAGGLAHDFNNILGVVDLEIENLIQKARDPSVVEESASSIQGAVGRASHLVRQLLTIGRKHALSLTQVDLNQLVMDYKAMLRIGLGDEKYLDLKLAPALPEIHADPRQLEQILMNLVVNARDATGSDGRVVIETALDTGSPQTPVKLSVRDNGCGMDEATRSHIFEPFFTTKEIGKGSGLGLSSVRSIVQQHGARIQVESEPGKGSAFHIWFPIEATP